MPLCTRQILRRTLGALAERGYDFVAGLEVEFHLFKLEKTRLGVGDAGQPGEPPEVSLLNQGYQYLTEQRYDEMDPILEILRTNLVDLGLPLRTLEVEFGPSQVEFTFRTGTGLDPEAQRPVEGHRPAVPGPGDERSPVDFAVFPGRKRLGAGA